jgi:hypothetical protein
MCYKVGNASDITSHRVFLARSYDQGYTWTSVSSEAAATGSVPTIVKDASGRILLYVPGG